MNNYTSPISQRPMTPAATLRPLDPVGDRAALEGLWSAALDPPWPLLPGGLDATRSGLVAEGGGRVKGAVGTDPAGSIKLLLVHPAYQRQGVGTLLLGEALRRFRALGLGTVSLGSGGEEYIWPGVPDNLPDAVRFFTARGWRFDDAVIDLVRDLRGYDPPAGVHERAARAGTTIELAGDEDRASVVAFETETFPSWLKWFQRGDSSVLVARDPERRVVGSLLFRGPGPVSVFAPLLGPMAGTIGCVGVAGHAQDRGIGTAMVARASELLRDAGTRMCHIGWVSRQAFYVRVGYTPWRRYLMSQRHLWNR
jgi:ribosomal protein S18 acetylase RimI-like enzyme